MEIHFTLLFFMKTKCKFLVEENKDMLILKEVSGGGGALKEIRLYLKDLY